MTDVKANLQTVSLASLAPAEWFSDPSQSSSWLRIYSALFIPRESYIQRVTDFVPPQDANRAFLGFGGPILFAWGFLEGMKVPESRFEMFAQDSGQLLVKVQMDQRELADTNYVYLCVPFRVDGKPGNEGEAKSRLDAAVGLLTLHTGLNFARDLFFDGEVAASDGKISVPSRPFKNPQPPEGPFLAPANGLDVADISTRLKHTPEPKKGRLLLALRLMNTAMRKDHGFFEYWTALEEVADGKRNRIQSRLAKVYGLKNHVEAGKATRLNILAEWRHDYVHKGVRPPLSADVERYIQLLFLDLLRHELDLSPRRHLVAIQNAKGFNLSPLKLPDNCTDEQKERIRHAMERAKQDESLMSERPGTSLTD